LFVRRRFIAVDLDWRGRKGVITERNDLSQRSRCSTGPVERDLTTGKNSWRFEIVARRKQIYH
jgi:hypothetical protein